MNWWRFSLQLSCGHTVERGVVTTHDCEKLTPRRKDGSFASLVCPHRCGRRRVVSTLSSLLHGRAP